MRKRPRASTLPSGCGCVPHAATAKSAPQAPSRPARERPRRRCSGPTAWRSARTPSPVRSIAAPSHNSARPHRHPRVAGASSLKLGCAHGHCGRPSSQQTAAIPQMLAVGYETTGDVVGADQQGPHPDWQRARQEGALADAACVMQAARAWVDVWDGQARRGHSRSYGAPSALFASPERKRWQAAPCLHAPAASTLPHPLHINASLFFRVCCLSPFARRPRTACSRLCV